MLPALASTPQPSPGYLKLLTLAPQDVNLVGLEGRHILLHLNGQFLGVGPLLWQLLWEAKAGGGGVSASILPLGLFKYLTCRVFACTQCPERSEEDAGASGTGVTGGCELPPECWELKTSPLQK